MKVDGNAPAFPLESENPDLQSGIPIRLRIAAELLAGRFANDSSDFGTIDGTNEVDESSIALHWADALIKAHNETNDTQGGTN